MEGIMGARLKMTEEQVILDHMINTLGQARANARIENMAIPNAVKEEPS